MKQSTDRILTTHVGSLIRPEKLKDFLRARRGDGGAYDEAAHEAYLKEAVKEVVREQEENGVDVVSDGEFGKSISWSQYALERLSGFERRVLDASTASPFARGEDRRVFSEFYKEMDEAEARSSGSGGELRQTDSVCVGPIKYTGHAALQRDIDNFKAAIAATNVTEGFLPVAAPASVIPDRKNEFYGSEEEITFAIAEAMRDEYKQIVDAGLVVQVDDARAAVTKDRMVPPASMEDYLKWLDMQQNALNHALEGIPADKIRYHVCWGSWPGPHTTDVPIQDIMDLILKVNAGAYVLEMANPRHEHEWQVWKDVKLPAGKVLIPGVISHATNVVEHPELVAERITRVADLVGRENVIAGTDCGFAQGPFHRRVHPSIQWAKLKALSDGAEIASKKLWA